MTPTPLHPSSPRRKKPADQAPTPDGKHDAPGQNLHGHRRLQVEDVTVVERGPMRQAIAGTIVGNLMEWYDVGVYGYLAVLIGRVFLPEAAPSVKSLFSLGVFAVTFVARPLGGIILGQLGDRLGRHRVLALTLTMMSASTFLIGILPDYSVIGAWAPILLIVLKLAQGFSTGGEYAGATTFITEYAPDRHRGFYASLLDLGSYLGFANGAAVVSSLQLTMSGAAMEGYVWRVPFLIALPLALIAIYFRLKIEDSPAYLQAQAGVANRNQNPTKGIAGLVRSYWREILTAFVLVAAANTLGYAVTSYMPTYLTTTLGYDTVHGNLLTLPVLVLMSLGIPVAGALSDRTQARAVRRIGGCHLPGHSGISAHDARAVVVDPAGSFPARRACRPVRVEPRIRAASTVSHVVALWRYGNVIQPCGCAVLRYGTIHHGSFGHRYRGPACSSVLDYGNVDGRIHRGARHGGECRQADARCNAHRSHSRGSPSSRGDPG